MWLNFHSLPCFYSYPLEVSTVIAALSEAADRMMVLRTLGRAERDLERNGTIALCDLVTCIMPCIQIIKS